MTDMDDPRFVWMPDDEFTKSNGIVQVYRNRWWICHPKTLDLLFVHVGLGKNKKANIKSASPQCNENEGIARQILAKAYPWAEIRFVPLVLKPIEVRDYA